MGGFVGRWLGSSCGIEGRVLFPPGIPIVNLISTGVVVIISVVLEVLVSIEIWAMVYGWFRVVSYGGLCCGSLVGFELFFGFEVFIGSCMWRDRIGDCIDVGGGVAILVALLEMVGVEERLHP